MASTRIENYLKAHRRRTGLFQREAAFLLGLKNAETLSRYEKHRRLPPLAVALACEAIFKKPVSELFAGARELVHRDVKGRLGTLGLELRKSPVGRRRKGLTTRKLSWIAEEHGQ